MLGRQRCFVLSLILESQNLINKCPKRPSLHLLDSLLKEVVLESFQFGLFTFLRDRRMSYHSTDCLLLKSIFFQLKIFLLDVTNIKIISHLNVSRQRCFVLSLISESQSFDLQVSKTTKLIFA